MNESLSQSRLVSKNSTISNGSRLSKRLLNDLDLGNNMNIDVNDVNLNNHMGYSHQYANNNLNNNYGQ